ncbi:MAG: endonuclease domain-containing protein [Betaproteobacteria bacterium]|nr:endonuclease domain-containing protein [Betaproteobacteria bacterium]
MRNFVAQRHARALRNDATDVERHLWRWLRRRQLSGFRFRRQVPIGPYVADFACLEAKVVVEVDGGQHLDRRETDQRRDREIRNRGFQVLRFWDNQVLRETQAVVEEIMRAVERHRPHPDLPPQAGEGTEGSDFPRQVGEGN